jgi:hypothetical protein
MNASLADLRALRTDLHARPPAWFPEIVASGFGRRTTNGQLLDDFALRLLVAEKRPNRQLGLGARIPSTIDGLGIDVTGPLPPPSPDSIEASGSLVLGCGEDVAGRHGEYGTVGCVGISYEGRPVLITTNHVIASKDTAFRWSPNDHPTVGTGGYSVLELTGQELYGSAAAHPEELFQVEATRVDPVAGLTLQGGMPGNVSFSVQPTTELWNWLQGAYVVSYGASTGGWRTGHVVMLFPRRPDVALTGLCLIQETGQRTSANGDSGSLWAAQQNGGFVAVGLHWGQVWANPNSPIYTFVTELQAALPWLRVRTLVGDANWQGTT